MEIKKAALENKIILYRYDQRLCSERVRFSFAFVVCSVFLNITKYNKGKFYHVLYDEQQISC